MHDALAHSLEESEGVRDRKWIELRDTALEIIDIYTVVSHAYGMKGWNGRGRPFEVPVIR